MTGPFAAATSQHPLATHAVGEAVGAVLEATGPGPDLAVLFLSPHHREQAATIADAVQRLLAPRVLLGATTAAVVGDGHELEGRPAVGLWTGHLGPVEPFRIGVQRREHGLVLDGTPPALLDPASEPRTVLLLADPFSFPADAFLEHLPTGPDGVRVVGGLASAAPAPGGNRLLLGDTAHADGAVGAVLPAGTRVETVVSQGCRPVGAPYTVTRAERNLVLELGSRPALDRLRETVDELGPDDRARAQQGLHVGLVVDEHRAEFTRGDFLVRAVLGADPEHGAVAVGELVDVGATVQFHVRDEASADDDLRALLAGRRADAALLFTCTGRGSQLFDEPDHDVRAVTSVVAPGPVAGMFCAGELGPVAGRNALHSFTASVVLFGH